LFDFGRYEVLEEMGRGAMGVVYKAREQELDRMVALKLIRKGGAATPECSDRFVAEARLAAQASHDGVVRMFDAGEYQGQRFLAMELLEGPTLADGLASSQMPPADAASTVSKLARAVHHLHQLGIVHRDLKPSNVILAGPDGQPRVTDFGLASTCAEPQGSSDFTIAGTPGYMSPEQLGVEVAEIGPRSDIYALGVMLFEAATGSQPFRADTPNEVLMRSFDGRFDRPRTIDPKVPRKLEAIILKAMERKPANRYATAEALAEDLDRFIAGTPVDAGSGGLATAVRAYARRHLALTVRFCAFATFFLVALANWAMGFVDDTFLLGLGSTLVVWAGLTVALDHVAHRSAVWPRVWCLVDVALVTRVILLLDGVRSSLVLLYPLLIVSVGLWSRARLVWFASLASALGYAALVVDSVLWRTELARPVDAHVVFGAVTLATAGLTIVHLRRFEALRRLYTRA